MNERLAELKVQVQRLRDERTVVVKNVAAFAGPQDISSHFTCCGKLSKVTPVQSRLGRTNYMVEYEAKESATKALSLASSTLQRFKDMRLLVRGVWESGRAAGGLVLSGAEPCAGTDGSRALHLLCTPNARTGCNVP